MNELPKFVIWLDPGLHTGWAALTDGAEFHSGEGILPEIGELLTAHGIWHREDMAIGWEQYIVAPGGGRAGSPGPPIEVIGMARWLGFYHHCQMLKPVPSAMRTVVKPEHLKKLGWYRPGKDHANQAARHLLAWMLREKLVPQDMKDTVFGECQTLLED